MERRWKRIVICTPHILWCSSLWQRSRYSRWLAARYHITRHCNIQFGFQNLGPNCNGWPCFEGALHSGISKRLIPCGWYSIHLEIRTRCMETGIHIGPFFCCFERPQLCSAQFSSMCLVVHLSVGSTENGLCDSILKLCFGARQPPLDLRRRHAIIPPMPCTLLP